jgi:hypothetical protein
LRGAASRSPSWWNASTVQLAALVISWSHHVQIATRDTS